MAKVSVNQLKQWFVTGSKPIQTQYYNWMDSYWHKDELISQSQIDGLATTLGNKADADQFQYYAKKDATNIDAVAWRNVLGVGSVDLSNYYTITQVDNLIANVTVDLSGYYTKAEVDGKLTAVYKTKGSVANYAALPTTGRIYGDVWNLIDTGDNYVWVANLNNTGNAGWDKLSGIIDLTSYHTITQYQSWVGQNYANLSNMVTSWSSTPSNTKFPSEKLVKDSLDAAQVQKYKTINSDSIIDDTYHNCIVSIVANCNITIPSGLRADLNIMFDVVGLFTATFIQGSGVTISAPFGFILRDNMTATLYRRASGVFRLTGGLMTS